MDKVKNPSDSESYTPSSELLESVCEIGLEFLLNFYTVFVNFEFWIWGFHYEDWLWRIQYNLVGYIGVSPAEFSACCMFLDGFLLGLQIGPEDGDSSSFPKCRWTSTRAHGVISQMTVLFNFVIYYLIENCINLFDFLWTVILNTKSYAE
jgi:hypothetical protein